MGLGCSNAVQRPRKAEQVCQDLVARQAALVDSTGGKVTAVVESEASNKDDSAYAVTTQHSTSGKGESGTG